MRIAIIILSIFMTAMLIVIGLLLLNINQIKNDLLKSNIQNSVKTIKKIDTDISEVKNSIELTKNEIDDLQEKIKNNEKIYSISDNDFNNLLNDFYAGNKTGVIVGN